MKKFQTLTGMHDILPGDYRYFDKIYKTAENLASFYNYGKIETPILEDTNIFLKGTGKDTEIVEKQMYSFESKSGKSITLRPEMTPGIVRAYIENGMASLPQPIKLYCCGPAFRYERPQAGRYRQFHQFNFDILGDKSYITDVEIIQIAYLSLQELGLKDIIIEINSLGEKKCRVTYNKALKKYLKKYSKNLCQNCLSKIDKNPLRFLDCKESSCQEIKAKNSSDLPKIIDYLEEEPKKDFMNILETLDYINIPYRLNHSLVRGLDYYTKTVFEILPDKKEGASSLGGGGRYDNMIKLFGGGDVPACGFAIGIERVVNQMKEMKIMNEEKYRFYLAQLGALAKNDSFKILETLRKNNISNIYFSLQKESLRAQLSQADKLNVKYMLILGQQEVIEKKIIIRNMKTGEQDIIKQENLLQTIKKL